VTRRAGPTWAATIAAVVVALVLAFLVYAHQGMTVCGGDGGLRNAAPASPQGGFCDSVIRGPAPVVAALLLGPAGVVLASAVVSRRRARSRAWPVGLVVAAALVIAPPTASALLPDTCSGTSTNVGTSTAVDSDCAHQ
jgi:hypothetical protein